MTDTKVRTRDDELARLDSLVDNFAEEMKIKLYEKYDAGYRGWDDPNLRPIIERKLRNHVERGRGQYVDIANLAAMLWLLD